ncbi:zinc finger swim-type [Lucifera butyrica]|uniref:Zinc finger swim-type n=1 Tax=Lucifera butyrica TaxID=1351585 RepID=A0A498RC54_9FIRM|nr:DEAD/DEAH box helicase [Lucifera butyrica]VBB06728.1 zinc finger swim-type [Lucifera butyrica]
MITDQWIKTAAAGSASYSRGFLYYRNHYVRQLQLLPGGQGFWAQVEGGQLYNIEVQFDQNKKITHYSCDCPAFSSYPGACKHLVAVFMTLQKNWTQYFPEEIMVPPAQPLPFSPEQRQKTSLSSRAVRKLLTFFTNEAAGYSGPTGQTPAKLLPTLFFSLNGGQKNCWLEFTIGNERMYILKDITQFLNAATGDEKIIFGKHFVFEPRTTRFDAVSQALLQLMQQAYLEDKQRSSWSYSSTSCFANPRQFKMTTSNLQKFFTAVADRPFPMVINGNPVHGVRINDGRPPLNLEVKMSREGLRLIPVLDGNMFYGLDTNFEYIYYHQVIYRVDADFSRYIGPFLTCLNETQKNEVLISLPSASDFFSAMLPALKTIGSVTLDSEIYARFRQEPLESRVYLDRFDAGISARIEFHYGETVVNPAASFPQTEIQDNDLWLIRETAAENQLLTLFRQYGFQRQQDIFVQPVEEAAYQFLRQALPELRDLADIYYSDRLKTTGIRLPGRIAAGVRLNPASDMLEFSLQYEDLSCQELFALLEAYKLKKNYHRLPDGTFIPLDSPDFQAAAFLIDQLGLRPSDLEKQQVELPKYRALYLDSLAREAADFPLERNHAFKKLVQDIKEPRDTDYRLPPGIHTNLRSYQKTGFKWLNSLAEYGLGGILADDMGLGKTLQVLAFLLAAKEKKAGPSLVIAPTSLLYNWQEEAAKFTPGLKVTVIAGQQAERCEQLQDFSRTDLFVTSYGLIKRDIRFYKDKEFRYCFLDEAQHIKNPQTLSARAVKQIRAQNCFALTGTPIENTLTELWSIFDFLMPGYLLNHASFLRRFEIPIVKNKEETALTNLKWHTRPFILRRMKKEVLHELPEKIESKLSSEMTPEQSKLYAAWLLKARTEFENEVQANGFEHSRIKILSLLTRLRQICCHPALFVENYPGGSGKLDLLEEILSEAAGSGHRVLLFSQFTAMLQLIQQRLEHRQISYHYLDGTTKAADRIKLVHSFNAGEREVFLISLKAGGTGLNLTGADMVIHYDPWWNPAVEEQATDRAYRIGQKKSVQVYKLITKDTIEEKIYLLQQKKKELIDTLIKPGENFLNKMNETEIRQLFDST